MAELLILAETDGRSLSPATLPAIAFSQELGGGFDLLIVGATGIDGAVAEWAGYGAERILVAAAPELEHPTADRVAAVCIQAMAASGARSLIATASSFGRDVLPRAAALLGLPMVSDVIGIDRAEGRIGFRRPMYAGNLIATVQVPEDRGVFSVRSTAYAEPQKTGGQSAVETVPVDGASLPNGTTWIGLEGGEQKRPELTSARVVVSGGRPLRDAETFERVLGSLADKLGGAVGATRAAVDSGIAPNELQVGQTGKVVAPDLYIAAGVSGSVQHLAGMKDSKVIVAINNDPDAPIFDVADYGLVADLHQAVPELTSKL